MIETTRYSIVITYLRCRRLVQVHKGNVTLTTIGVGDNICRYKKGERSWMALG